MELLYRKYDNDTSVELLQILSAIPLGLRAIVTENCVTSWDIFAYLYKVNFFQNMIALPSEK